MWPFRKPKPETRSSGSGYTAQVLAARESYISGRSGIGELTATVQAAVSLWEGALSLADVSGTDLLDRRTLALVARSLALRGEVLLLIRDRLMPATDWDVTARQGIPTAYRLTIPGTGGGESITALAGEVLHFRIGSDVTAPWAGSAPLHRARLTAGLLHTLETALAEIFETAPIGSQVVPFPEAPDTDMETLARGFRGARGRVLVRESVSVAAAGGPAPTQDWKPQDVTPDLSRSMTKETLAATRDEINHAFGILPGLVSSATTGPMVREAQRHLAQWTLQPIAAAIAEECTDKLGQPVTLDVMRPLQAFDAGGRARALSAIIKATAEAKEAGVDPSEALRLVDWEN